MNYIYILIATTLFAQDKFKTELGLTFHHFQQQVKADVGDAQGEKLVDETTIAINLAAFYPIYKSLSVGLFLQYENGHRKAASFNGFDADGVTQTINKSGGDFNELWFGPILKYDWKQLFLEFGHGTFAYRNDDARSDILNSDGKSEGSFSTKASISWLVNIGGNIKLSEKLYAMFKVNWRIRYYNERDGIELKDKIHHGTQNISPFIGLGYSF